MEDGMEHPIAKHIFIFPLIYAVFVWGLMLRTDVSYEETVSSIADQIVYQYGLQDSVDTVYDIVRSQIPEPKWQNPIDTIAALYGMFVSVGFIYLAFID